MIARGSPIDVSPVRTVWLMMELWVALQLAVAVVASLRAHGSHPGHDGEVLGRSEPRGVSCYACMRYILKSE